MGELGREELIPVSFKSGVVGSLIEKSFGGERVSSISILEGLQGFSAACMRIGGMREVLAGLPDWIPGRNMYIAERTIAVPMTNYLWCEHINVECFKEGDIKTHVG